MKNIEKCSLLLLIAFSFFISAQKLNSDIGDKILKVENSLSPSVISGSDKVPSYNILDRMKQFHVKGVSIAVINNYKIEWIKGYGYADEEEGRKVDVNTLFQAASISKTINSLGFMKLVQLGSIDLDKDINTYLKSWKFPYDSISKRKIITSRNLLSHSAGLGGSGFMGYERNGPIPDIVQVLDGISPANSKPVRSIKAPGLEFDYSGGGTVVSQLILTDTSGKSYEEFMKKEVFEPLQMTHSTYSLKNDTLNIALGYYSDGKKVKGKYHLYPEYSAAGLWTTPEDLAKYMIECQLALKGKSEKVLTQKYMEERFTPVVNYKESKVALGVFHRYKNGVYYFNHNGGNEGFTCASYGSLDKGYGVVVMTNTNNQEFMLEICNSVARVYDWDRFFVPRFTK
ncbi:class A beta-lactamase-related serine hydrolase [Chryseobacterium sp. G0162]|uniref:serine hydrolase domain-containing protein n=1 Tax=Chryseobacterium sp. G0162 TaxID=2487063 RepID=UPI000F510397|nr:serine hydrolase domain-containing protein [Chryseobacterium sp. G0162]AZB11556.1 class A beta-lactamase-related serine hydrolase [Chryseobacterium sp. G0162]